MLNYDLAKKKKASTLLALGLSELEAAGTLVESELFREAIVHLYFCSYYVTQGLLQNQLGQKNSHAFVETQLHKIYGRAKWFPRRYIELHVDLHKLRNNFNYRHTHVPNPRMVRRKLAVLRAYVKFASKHIPAVRTIEILRSIYEENRALIRDFSYDVYCPKTYSHHTRITFWQPPFYLEIFGPDHLVERSRMLLKSLKVKRTPDYVVGLNSRLDQYRPVHLIMLDIDSVDSIVEHELKKIGGVLLKSGRGFHFIGSTVVEGQKAWEVAMRKLRRSKDLGGHLDRDHIDISLRRGYATLRVTTSPVKPTAPVFYKEL